MSLLGIGLVEVAIILLIAFLVLGPSRSIDLARAGGRLVRNLRSVLADLNGAIDLERRDTAATGGASPADPEPGEAPTPRNRR